MQQVVQVHVQDPRRLHWASPPIRYRYAAHFFHAATFFAQERCICSALRMTFHWLPEIDEGCLNTGSVGKCPTRTRLLRHSQERPRAVSLRPFASHLFLIGAYNRNSVMR